MRRRIRPSLVRVVALGVGASACASSAAPGADAGPPVDVCATLDGGCAATDAPATRDAMDVSATGDVPAAADVPRVCPTMAPADGAPCVHEGLSCEWLVVDPVCAPPLNTRGPSAFCWNGRWQVGDNTCNPPAPVQDAGPDGAR